MSYERKLTTFKKGNQLSDCEEYNLEDLQDMFSDTQFTNSELYLEDVLTESKSFNGKFDLNSTVTVVDSYSNDEGNMYMLLEDDVVECSLELDYEFYYQSI